MACGGRHIRTSEYCFFQSNLRNFYISSKVKAHVESEQFSFNGASYTHSPTREPSYRYRHTRQPSRASSADTVRHCRQVLRNSGFSRVELHSGLLMGTQMKPLSTPLTGPAILNPFVYGEVTK